MTRTIKTPPDSKKSRPKTAGEVIIENLKKDGAIVGIEVGGEKWPIEKLCRHEDCPYCENCPMHLFFDLEDIQAYYGQCELMVCIESEGCPLSTALIEEYLDPTQNTPEELACHEFAYGFVCFGLGVKGGLDWIEKAAKDGSREAKQFLKHLNKKK